MARLVQVFDGHNDMLSRLWSAQTDPVALFESDAGHVNIPAIQKGGMGGGFCALYSKTERKLHDFTAFKPGDFDFALPPMMDAGVALEAAIGQAAIAHLLNAAGHLTICTDAQTLARSFVGDSLTCILHLEGADCIGPDLLALDALYAMGLRSLGPVWSRPTIFGHGVPFGNDSDGDTGPGLTDDGKRLIARCKELGVMIDTSHLTMKGFWDVGDAGLPLVATHSNAYAVAKNTRNLTDDQLHAIAQSGGIAGLNFATVFLSDAGWETGRATLDDCIRQLDHMINVAGEDHVALGSDFDGAPLPEAIGSAADLPNLIDAMRSHGYGDALIAKIAHENWLSFLSTQLG